jgi:hypothetical protein
MLELLERFRYGQQYILDYNKIIILYGGCNKRARRFITKFGKFTESRVNLTNLTNIRIMVLDR